MLSSPLMPITWVKVPKYKCRTCGYEWFPRNPGKPGKPPKQCPKCHNAYWNEPRVNKRKDVVVDASNEDGD